jgi:hypothetical protein
VAPIIRKAFIGTLPVITPKKILFNREIKIKLLIKER